MLQERVPMTTGDAPPHLGTGRASPVSGDASAWGAASASARRHEATATSLAEGAGLPGWASALIIAGVVVALAQREATVEKIAWKLAASAVGAGAGLLVTKASTIAWRRARHTEPPTDPTSRRTNRGDALVWAGAVAAVAGVAKAIAIRGAAAGWEKATGQLPPGVEAYP
jgi:hypothetical protein